MSQDTLAEVERLVDELTPAEQVRLLEYLAPAHCKRRRVSSLVGDRKPRRGRRTERETGRRLGGVLPGRGCDRRGRPARIANADRDAAFHAAVSSCIPSTQASGLTDSISASRGTISAEGCSISSASVPCPLYCRTSCSVAGAISRSRNNPAQGETLAISIARLANIRLVPLDDFLAREALILAARHGLPGRTRSTAASRSERCDANHPRQ